jgi:4-aminobutyrate aminotransferase-like enzyme
MACAAGLATLEVMDEDNIMERVEDIGNYILRKLNEMKNVHPIIGDVRGKGCLLGIEFVKNRETKEPFYEAGALVYEECMKKKLIAGVPVIHLLRLAPQLIINKEMIDTGLSILDDSIYEIEKRLGSL